LGLPDTLEKVDGAVRWGYNDKTYFFSGKHSNIPFIERLQTFDKLALYLVNCLLIFRNNVLEV
jgi:hypothetical protein